MSRNDDWVTLYRKGIDRVTADLYRETSPTRRLALRRQRDRYQEELEREQRRRDNLPNFVGPPRQRGSAVIGGVLIIAVGLTAVAAVVTQVFVPVIERVMGLHEHLHTFSHDGSDPHTHD